MFVSRGGWSGSGMAILLCRARMPAYATKAKPWRIPWRHGAGHLEKVDENAVVHRLRRQGLAVEQQKPLTVFDGDGTVIGELFADIVVEGLLILELKAAKAVADEHFAKTLGCLRSARLEHGALLNFGATKF